MKDISTVNNPILVTLLTLILLIISWIHMVTMQGSVFHAIKFGSAHLCHFVDLPENFVNHL